MQKILKIITDELRRSAAMTLIAVLLVCPLSALLLILPIWLYNEDRISEPVLTASTMAYGAVFLIGSFVMIVWISHRRAKNLDAIFTPLGLAGKPYLTIWREYQGRWDSRDVIIRFYRGPTLTISVKTSVRTRFQVTGDAGLNLAPAAPYVRVAVPNLPSIAVQALDPDWTANLLAQPALEKSIRRLIDAASSWALFRQVTLAPGMLTLTLYRSKNLYSYPFTGAEIQQWLIDLVELTRQAETLPPPVVTAEETRMEIAARTGAASRYAVLILVVSFGIIGLCIAAVIWFLVVSGI